MNFPQDLKYTKDHEWIKMDGDTATIGITEFAQRELGDIVYVDISSKGKAMSAEEVFGTVEAVKTVSDLFLPAAGALQISLYRLSHRYRRVREVCLLHRKHPTSNAYWER